MRTFLKRIEFMQRYAWNQIKEFSVQYSYYDEEASILYLVDKKENPSYHAYLVKPRLESRRFVLTDGGGTISLIPADFFLLEKKRKLDQLILDFKRKEGKPEICAEPASTATAAFFANSLQSSVSDTKKTDTISLKHTI